MNELKTAPALILNLPNIVLERFIGKKNFLPLWISAMILGLLICLPSYFGEVNK